MFPISNGMKNRNLAFIDVETTGLLLDKHEIIEIGCVLVSQDNSSNTKFKKLEEFEIKVKPENIKSADPVALKINGYNEKGWKDGVKLKEAMEILSQKTDGAMMVGHNVSFDWAFLEKAFQKTGVRNNMHHRKLDTISIAFAKLYDIDNIDKLSLKSLCGHFGVKNEKAHTALSDTIATFEVFVKLMNSK